MSTTSDISSSVNHAMDSASDSVHKVINLASDAARPAFAQMTSGAHHAVDKLAHAATQVSESIESKSERLWDAQHRLTDKCLSHVKAQPVSSLGIAVAAGFILGWLLRNR